MKLHKTKSKKNVGGYIGYGGDDRLSFFQRNKKKLRRFMFGTTTAMPKTTTTPDFEGILDNEDGK